jgi:hypothetical protein
VSQTMPSSRDLVLGPLERSLRVFAGDTLEHGERIEVAEAPWAIEEHRSAVAPQRGQIVAEQATYLVAESQPRLGGDIRQFVERNSHGETSESGACDNAPRSEDTRGAPTAVWALGTHSDGATPGDHGPHLDVTSAVGMRAGR